MNEHAWEVRDSMDDDGTLTFRVERGTTRTGDLELGAARIRDYGLACVIEAALNLRDGTVE